MLKINSILKKVVLSILLLGTGLAMLPSTSALAADLPDQPGTTAGGLPASERLERAWARLQRLYDKQSERLARSDDFIARIGSLIEKADGKGWDTSEVQAALEAFVASLPTAAQAHDAGAAIIDTHAGFDENGKVTDRQAAHETLTSLRKVMRNVRDAMDGTGEELRHAIRELFEAHGESLLEPRTP